ncbi:MAG: acetylxylan esterase [Prevotella sp.]
MKLINELKRATLLYLLVCFAVVTNSTTTSAAVTEKTINLFTGETICADDWTTGFQKIAAAAFANANKGDKISVTVSAVSSTCSYSQVALQNGSWANFDPNQSVHVTEPGKVEFTITADMLTEMKSSGLVVKGCGYTFTSVDLITYIESGDTKAIAVTLPIWTCNTTCPDNWGNSEYIPADKFQMVTSGAMLKVHVTAVSATAQWPQARLNTKGYAKMSESVAISDVDRDYSLLIPDDMLDEIRTNGVRVGGGGYTFDHVTLVTDVNVLTTEHETLLLYPDYDNSYIREFKIGEQPQLAFSFVNPEATAQNVDLVVTLTRDNGNAVNTYSRTISAAASDGTTATVTPCTINLSQDMTEAGVYHFTATYNGNAICSYNIAYNLEGINCPADSKADFKQFWDNALAELAATAPEYDIEEYTDGKADSDLRTIYKVTMKSTPNVVGEQPVTVAGFLAVPKGEEGIKHPVIITYQGTDGGTGKLNVPSRTATGEFIDFVFSTRGQQLCRDDQPTYYPEGKTSPDYYAYGLGDSHKHYYYGGNLDCARAVDFLCSDIAAQYGVDKDNIFAAGGSQGGSFCYAAAFLGGSRVKAIAPSITGHSDFRHNTECVDWPKNVFQNFIDNNADWTWDKLFEFLSYYDVKNFAPYITCPVITNFSLQDTTDPTHTNIAPYLLLTQVDAADKAYSLNNFNGHAAAADFSTTYTAFFKKYLTNASSDEPVEGFHTSGTQLLDKNGNPFVMRGFNYSYCWQQSYEEAAFQKAVESKCNSMRIQLGNGDTFTKTSLDEVKELISRCKANKLIAVLNVHDTTGSDSEETLASAVDYWIEMKEALSGEEAYVIVNIGNEWVSKWADGATLWQTGYVDAVQRLRAAGIKNTLMIDCAGYGQYPDVVWNNGEEVLNADRTANGGNANVMFSIHFYEYASWIDKSTDNPSAWDTSVSNSRVAYTLGKALEVNAPVCVGEFGCSRNNGTYPIDWQTILSECKERQIGYLAWSFAKNGDTDSCLDMFDADNSWAMLQNGTNIIEHEGDGIRATAVSCTVYESSTEPEGDNVLFTGPTAIDWNNGTYVLIANTAFANAKIGDRIVLNITYTGNVSYPQVALNNATTWTALAGAGNEPISEATTQVVYTLTATMLNALKTDGLVISGHGYTLDNVVLEAGNGGAGMENAVWIGEKVMPSDWSAYVTIPASCFTNVVVGNELRLHHKDVKAGAQVSPRGSNWNTLPGTDAKQPEGAYTKYTITEEMLASLQSGGCIIGGCNYTLTYVEVVDPTTLKTLTLSVPVTDNWIYSDGKAEIKIEVKNENEEDMTANAELRVTTDKFVEYESLSQTADVKSGESTTLTFNFSAEPGFYHVTAIVNEETARAFNIGVDPTEIVSPTDKQDDFDAFWDDAKTELATVAIDATFTKIEEKSTAKRNVWLVEMKSIADSNGGEPAIIRGYYAEPVAEGKYPAIVHYQGYDSGYDPYCPDGNSNTDFCELYLSTRGQLINNRSPYENTYGDWFQFNFGDKDTYYYRGAYMDVLRAIDFLCSRDRVDSSNLFAEGASQGGAFTYAAATLSDHKLNAIASAIPFMGDFPDYFEVGSWPAYPAHLKQQELGLSDEEMFAFLSYFDTKNLATRISAPVMSCIGLQDDVCPPHTNIAPYNNLPDGVEKTITFNPELKHQTSSEWYDAYMAFFKSHMITTDISAPSAAAEHDDAPAYNLNGQRVARSYRGLVVRNGKKVFMHHQ